MVNTTQNNDFQFATIRISDKSRLAALLLNIFVGLFGIHRMYVGKAGTGVLQLLFTLSFIGIWISAIWVFIDMILIITGAFEDSKKQKLTKWITE